jgi:4a-hydroxytetrahydrobiopterin dehydratase
MNDQISPKQFRESEGVDDQRPDVDLRHDGVTVRMLKISEDYAGMTKSHVELARQISQIARRLGSPPTRRPSRACS